LWRTSSGKCAKGEELKETNDGLQFKSGEKKPLVVMQSKTFPSCHIGDRISISFEARGDAPWVSACLYLLTGSRYGAGTIQKRFNPTEEWQTYKFILTVSEADPKHPPTVYRPGFLVAPKGSLEIRNLTISAL
jgi:hypothetical protein